MTTLLGALAPLALIVALYLVLIGPGILMRRRMDHEDDR